MGKGRAPCCDKSQVKRGPWSPAEDLRLITFIQKHGHDNWRALPKQAGLSRCGKSCRLRWINYLRPDVKRGNFTKEEEDTIVKLHQTLGNKWSKIASYLPGRTDNEIKNVWNTHLKKRLALENGNPCRVMDESKESSITSSSSSSSSTLSSGKGNNGLDKLQFAEDATAKKPHESVKMTVLEDSQSKEPKELSNNSSMSSNNSNVTNSTSQVGVSNPKDRPHQVGNSLFELRGPNEVCDTLQEVNKPDILDNLIDIFPFESDIDFWNMLDGLGGSFQCNQVQLQQQMDATESTKCGEADQNREWFHYMENELKLGGNFMAENQEQIAAPDHMLVHDYNILLKPEVDTVISHGLF